MSQTTKLFVNQLELSVLAAGKRVRNIKMHETLHPTRYLTSLTDLMFLVPLPQKFRKKNLQWECEF